MAEYRAQHWSVELPDGWSAEREDESTLLHRATGGAGTLSVTLLCEKEPVTAAQLRELASSTIEEGHQPREIKVGGFTGLSFAYSEEGIAWREWYLPSGKCLFFISYDCPEEFSEQAQIEIAEIVATLRHLP